MVEVENLFYFLQEELPEAMAAATQMEKYIYTDTAAAGGKARTAAEFILKRVFEVEEIEDAVNTTLNEMIYYLSRHDYIKRDIQTSLDNIRRIGNKAIHGNTALIIEGLHLHKDLYKVAVWFYETYVSHADPVPTYREPTPQINEPQLKLEDIISAIEERQKSQGKDEKNDRSIKSIHEEDTIEGEQEEVNVDFESRDVNVDQTITQPEQITNLQSYSLLEMISRLKDSSKEAIESANGLSEFKKYLHIEREIQGEIVRQLSKESPPRLILLSGSVGDGKSHLLAYLKSTYPELIENYKIHNDATESFSPEMNALQTLEKELEAYKDQNMESSKSNTIVAINLGVLHNFIHSEYGDEFETLRDFVEKSKVFEDHVVPWYEKEDGSMVLINLADTHSYELTPTGPSSTFYKAIMEKVFSHNLNNPFFIAYKDDLDKGKKETLHENFEFMGSDYVQKQIIDLVIQAIVKDKLVVSTRSFLNFLADILIRNEEELIDNITPNLLFSSGDSSEILNSISRLDPLSKRSEMIDQLQLDLLLNNEWKSTCEEVIENKVGRQWMEMCYLDGGMLEETFKRSFVTFIRIAYLVNKKFAIQETENSLADPIFHEFMIDLYYFNISEKNIIKKFYNQFISAMFKWKGQPKKGYILMSKPNEQYKLAQQFTPSPFLQEYIIPQQQSDKLLYFKDNIAVSFSREQNSYSTKATLEIDYTLYSLLYKVARGYRPTQADEEVAVNFMEFMDRMMSFGKRQEELLIDFADQNKAYKLRHDGFGDFLFERE